MPVKVIPEKCPKDHKCPAVEACPVQAIEQEQNQAPKIDSAACIECGICTHRCPKGALVLD